MDDCGGGYSESIAEMCEELQNGSLPLLILTPNGRDEAGTNRDCFILNPTVAAPNAAAAEAPAAVPATYKPHTLQVTLPPEFWQYHYSIKTKKKKRKRFPFRKSRNLFR